MTSRCIYREEHEQTHLEIWEDGDRRSLWFDDVILQSEIHLDDPAVLPNPVNRAMLAHLMFEAPLSRVLLGGCGGGAIARWLHARAPEVVGHAVEISPTVARLAREYFDFPRPYQSNWRLMIGDIRNHIVECQTIYDFILVDLEENQATPAWATETGFLVECRDHLSADGVLTLNLLVEDIDTTSAALARIRRVFDATLLLTDPDHDNLLVMAFQTAVPEIPPPEQIHHKGNRWGLEFATFADRFVRID